MNDPTNPEADADRRLDRTTELRQTAQPGDGGAGPPGAGLSRTAKLVIGFAVLLGIVGIAGTWITVPYVIFSPGDATPVNDYIRIRGTRTYRHQGDVLLLTVRVSSERPNLWRFVEASLDDDSKVYGEEKVYGNVSRRRVERASVAMMEASKLSAQQAALTRLGYNVSVSGKGALVEKVVKRSPADRAGLRVGDVIVRIGTAPITMAEQVGPAVRSEPVGATLEVDVRRVGSSRTLPVASVAAPNGETKGLPYFGIRVKTDQFQVDFPVDISVDPEDVSGPSGGLAFALTMIDELTPGDLTGGVKVAVTGEIDGAGNVGDVGGVPQKAVTARHAGAVLMIVPRGEVREARAKAGDLKVVGVRTLDEALRVLERNGGAALPQ